MNRLRVSTAPPPPGMKVNCPPAASLPPLKSVSSVRHTDPPMPFVCAAAGTSERYDVGAAMVMTCDIVDELAAFATVSDTPYEPCAEYACTGFCAVDVAPSPKLHCQDVGEPVERSVKVTLARTAGDAGVMSKAAETGGVAGIAVVTVTVCEAIEVRPPAGDTVRVTG